MAWREAAFMLYHVIFWFIHMFFKFVSESLLDSTQICASILSRALHKFCP